MAKSDDLLREIAKSLEGLALLSKWEHQLAEDLREKVGALLAESDRAARDRDDLPAKTE